MWFFTRKSRRNARNSSTPYRLWLEELENRRLLAFGDDGIVTTNIVATDGDWIEGLALQTDGRIVAAGNVGLVRYNADGALDASFNAGGSQPGTIAAGSYQNYFNDVAVQSDGKIVAAGMKLGAQDLDFLVRRYTPIGTPDTTFGVNGEATLAFPGGTHDEIEALAIQSDGKIVVVGSSHSSKHDWVVMRYLPNGSLDTSFDRDGKLTTSFGKKTSAPTPSAVVLQPNGKILVAGTVTNQIATGFHYDFTLVRYNSNGSLDQTFGQGGKLLTDFGAELGQAYGNDEARSITLQPDDGKIIVGGSTMGGITSTGSLFAMARYHSNGVLDASFGGDGRVSVGVLGSGWHRYEGLAIQPDGKIVGVGGDERVYVTRMNSDGSLDVGFNGTGLRHFSYEPAAYYTDGKDLLLQPDGKVVVGGGSGDPYAGDPVDFALARLNADGSFDAAAPLIAASGPATTSAADSLTSEQLVLAEASAHQQAVGAETSSPANLDDDDDVMAETLAAEVRRIDMDHQDTVLVDQVFDQWNDQFDLRVNDLPTSDI